MTRLIGITLVALAMVGACGSESPESMPFEAYCTGEGCSHSGVALASECVEAGHTWGALTTPEACEAAGHQWIDDPNEVDATTEVDDAPDVSACECEPEEHCSAEGECVSDVCVQLR